jgi:phage terminase large subunit
MSIIQLPAFGWKPRPQQMSLWQYMQNGGRHAEIVWHRRFGKDDVCLHLSARATAIKPATYWYMLPMQAQARKAIWKAVNPHTGRRRIDEVFPHAMRKRTNDQEMFIELVNGSTWQVLGSDNYDALVGSPPFGCVYSEWALADPAAAAYLQPIFNENGGFQLFNTTPRGRNHAYRSLQAAQESPKRFASVLTIDDTRVFSNEQITEMRRDYQARFGDEIGDAIFEQEYYCSFDIPVVGAVYGKETRLAQQQGRITTVPFNPALPVHTSWDLGRADKTTIWFFQFVSGEVRIIDYLEKFGQPIDWYITELKAKRYPYGTMWVPHDADNQLLASKRTISQQLRDAGFVVRTVPKTSIAARIEATRQLFPLMYFDEKRTQAGRDALVNYRYDVQGVPVFVGEGQEVQTFSPQPVHDWASHASDSLGYMAVALKEDRPKKEHQTTPARRRGAPHTPGTDWMGG